MIFLDEKFYYNIICGVVAGALAAALCNPTDLLKVRNFKKFLYYLLLLTVGSKILNGIYSFDTLVEYLGSYASTKPR